MATIGPVSYPTSTTWEVEVTGLASGVNSFTVSDGPLPQILPFTIGPGTSLEVQATLRWRLKYGAVPLQIQAPSGGAYVATPLRLSDGTNFDDHVGIDLPFLLPRRF